MIGAPDVTFPVAVRSSDMRPLRVRPGRARVPRV
jgi:hypothetical protein